MPIPRHFDDIYERDLPYDTEIKIDFDITLVSEVLASRDERNSVFPAHLSINSVQSRVYPPLSYSLVLLNPELLLFCPQKKKAESDITFDVRLPSMVGFAKDTNTF